MPTQAQIKLTEKKLKEYKKRFLSRKNDGLDEASTRLMVNHFLTNILGYAEFDEIKTEYRIAGEYADYVIQLGRKKHFIVEVKSISLDLNPKHLRQGVNYAANEGIDWVLLTNGAVYALYRVIFGKPISIKKVFEHDLLTEKNLLNMSKDISLLSKKCVEKKELEKYWERFEVVEPVELSKILYQKNVISVIKRAMKQKADINFSEDEVLSALYEVIRQPIETIKPKFPVEVKVKKKKIDKV